LQYDVAFFSAASVACAEAKAKLISPFVGRILDWFKAKAGKDFHRQKTRGALGKRNLCLLQQFGHNTEVMGASFRNKGEILELAGCDLLTISPQLLGELKNSTEPVERKIDLGIPQGKMEKLQLDEKRFRWLLNENAMATEKLAEGIRIFNADAVKLEKYIAERL